MRDRAQSYAGLGDRVIAFALDYILVLLYLIVLAGIGLALTLAFRDIASTLFGDALTGQLTGFLLVTVPLIAYFALLESSPRQATWGKGRRGLKVSGPSAARTSRARALGRNLLKFVPWELGHTCIWRIRFAGEDPSPLIAVGFVLVYVLIATNLVWLWRSPTNQTLYDWLARTYVVKD